MGEDFGDAIDPTVREPARFQPLQPFLGCALAKNGCDHLLEHIAVLAPRFRILESWIREPFGMLDHVPAKGLPIGGTRAGDADVFLVAREIRSIGRDVLVAQAEALGLFATMPIMMREIAEPGDR